MPINFTLTIIKGRRLILCLVFALYYLAKLLRVNITSLQIFTNYISHMYILFINILSEDVLFLNWCNLILFLFIL